MEPRDLSDHEEYVAGRGIEEVARELGKDPDELITLSSNENPLGPSPAAVAAIREFADEVHQYPKAVHTDLTDAIAGKWGVDSSQVWLAPGGDGALDYLARAMLVPGDSVLVPEPGFAYYGMSARFHHARVNTYRLAPEDDFELSAPVVLEAADQHRIVYLTSPHNPTGGRFSVSEVEQIARETSRDTLVIV
ncbi:MAG: aminotransferase class I/II-fold pyridoxal phosphate-dependent enzyme, partial [Halodesulfurarchaeum sp.]